MRNIERLLARAKNLHGKEKCYIIAIVDHDSSKGVYTASCTVWDGVTGSGGEFTHTEHSTAEAAYDACNAVLSQYPGAVSKHVFVNDMSLPGGEE